MLIEIPVSGPGQIIVIILASVTLGLLIIYGAFDLFSLVLRTIQRAANRG